MISASLCLSTLLILIWVHFIADFLLQSDWMAVGKSSSNKILSIHVLTYITPFLLLCGWKFALVNYALHWLTDFCSSRATTKLWMKGLAVDEAKKAGTLPKDTRNPWRHWFFAVIGLDQAIHATCLLLTIPLIGW